jgi:uroporphyrinogen decarboxylase
VNDRFLRACRREPVDATPVWFMRQAGRSLPEYRRIRQRATLADIVGDAELCAEVTLQPVRRLGVDAAILFADITTPLAGMGVGVELVDRVGPVIERPIRSLDDVTGLHTFEAETAVAPLLEAIRLLRGELDVPLIGFAGAPFTLANYLVEGRASSGATRLRTMLYAEPATADALLARLTDMTIDYLSAQAAAGAQALQIFDSWIGTLGPRTYGRFVAPHMRRLFASLADVGVPLIHFGTGNPALIAPLAAAGGDVIGIDWRIPLDDAWALVPGRAVQGNLDPVAVLGPWDAAAAEARAVLREADGRPGHIFNLGHGVLPETDPELLRGLVDLVHETTTRVEAPAGKPVGMAAS